jgi:hypothetical protein
MNAPQTTFILRHAQDERVFLPHPVFGAETLSQFVVSCILSTAEGLSNHGQPGALLDGNFVLVYSPSVPRRPHPRLRRSI